MEHRKELWAVLLVVVGVAAFLLYTAVSAIGQILAIKDSNPNTTTVFDMSAWQTYRNDTYGFSFNYPQNWQIYTNGLLGDTPFVSIGNPLQGTSTYALSVFIHKNPNGLSSGEYVHAFLADERAQDAANALRGPAPMVASQFTKSFITTVSGLPAYELFQVFEFDHNAERIYVAHGDTVLQLDFPVAEANPNLSSPIHNNALAHQIVNTLTFQ